MTGKYIDEEEGTKNKWKTGKMKKQMKQRRHKEKQGQREKNRNDKPTNGKEEKGEEEANNDEYAHTKLNLVHFLGAWLCVYAFSVMTAALPPPPIIT